METAGNEPNWGVIGTLVGGLAIVIAIIIAIAQNLIRKSDKKETRTYYNHHDAKLDDLGRDIKSIGNKLNVFTRPITEAPDKVRIPFYRSLKAIEQKKLSEAEAELLSLLETTNENKIISAITLTLAGVAFDRGDFKGSKRKAGVALRFSKMAGDEVAKGWVLNLLGSNARVTGKYRKAKQLYNEAIGIGEKYDEKDLIAIALTHLGLVNMHEGDYNSAIEMHEKSHRVAADSGILINQAIALGNLGLVLRLLGRESEAEEKHKEAYLIDKRIGNLHEQAQDLMHLGIIAVDRGEYEEARSDFNKSLQIFKKNRALYKEAEVLSWIAIVYHKKGMLLKALKTNEKPLAFYNKSGDIRSLGYIYNVKGTILHELGDHKGAIKVLMKALKINKRIKNKYGLAQTYNNLGLISLDLNDNEATGYFEKASKTAKRINAAHLLIAGLTNLGGLYIRQCKYKKATRALAAALVISEEHKLYRYSNIIREGQKTITEKAKGFKPKDGITMS